MTQTDRDVLTMSIRCVATPRFLATWRVTAISENESEPRPTLSKWIRIRSLGCVLVVCPGLRSPSSSVSVAALPSVRSGPFPRNPSASRLPPDTFHRTYRGLQCMRALSRNQVLLGRTRAVVAVEYPTLVHLPIQRQLLLLNGELNNGYRR
jgi:hypothetical protein